MTTHENGTMRLWDGVSGVLRSSLPTHSDSKVIHIGVFKREDKIVAITDDLTFLSWSLDGSISSQKPLSVPSDTSSLSFVKNSYSDQTLLMSFFDGTVWRIDLEGNTRGEPLKHNSFVHMLDVENHSRTTVTVSEDGTARLWGPKGAPIGDIMRHSSGVPLVFSKFDTSTERLVTASADGTVQVWSMEGARIGEEVSLGEDQNARQSIFSFNGEFIAVRTLESRIKIIDAPAYGQALFDASTTRVKNLKLSEYGECRRFSIQCREEGF